ncbi:MAG: hypothetical protein ABW098_09305 [Candidatus Thiodiazotropha sp.]
MKTKVWLIVGGTLLISYQLKAEDSGYDNRQFTINPGNMMGGMFNPMNNFFGGSDPYPNDYYSYPYAPPPGYPPAYGYPGAGYGYPPLYPGYQPLPQSGAYPAPGPTTEQPQSSTANVQPAPPATYNQPPSVQPGFTKKYRFRPLEANEPAANNNNSSSPITKQINSSVPAQPMGQAVAPQYQEAPQGGYGQGRINQPATQETQMKFRPLDQPGYSE